MTYPALESIGVKNIDRIEYYSVRSEVEQDILKIYYLKEKGALFHRSEKFKFPVSHKLVRDGRDFKDLSSASPMLAKVTQELDQITGQLKDTNKTKKDAKEKILSDLRHLEKVVANKISEIERHLKEL